MKHNTSFEDYVIVSCGTLRPELDYLQESGFLNARRILYTGPGLHEDYKRLKEQLIAQLEKAATYSENIIVVYGSSCYLDLQKEPPESIDALIDRSEGNISRIRAARCIDMLASAEQRKEISKEGKIYWITVGWLKYWKAVFVGWDEAKANETFPKYDKAILLDAVGFYERYTSESPEEILAFSDWMGIPIEPHDVTLDRLKGLLSDAIRPEE